MNRNYVTQTTQVRIRNYVTHTEVQIRYYVTLTTQGRIRN